jgi:hypothetical protein
MIEVKRLHQKSHFMLSLKKNPDLPVMISDKQMATNPPTKKEKLTPVGFRCNDEVYKYLQDKAVELSQEFLLDPRERVNM